MKLFFNKLLLFQIFYLLCIHLSPSFSATLYVGDETHSSIQSAVDAANDGDEIVVKAGEYKENIEVRKSVTIRSERGYTNTTVIDMGSGKEIFSVYADEVMIEGFSLYGVYHPVNSVSAIGLINVQQCTITQNRFGIDDSSQNDGGISIHNSSKNTIINNIIVSSRHSGIYIFNSNNNIITQNTLAYNQYGIYLYYMSNQNYIYLNSFINDRIDSLISNSFQQNIFHSPTPLIYFYKGNYYKQYLGNFYSNYDIFGNNKNGISENPYNYPYFEPYDEYPLLKPHDQYIIQANTISQNFPPIIYTVKPNISSIQGGNEIILSGSDFGNQMGTGKVTFGETQAEVLQWSNTKIICKAPQHSIDYVSITVTTDQSMIGSKNKAFLYYDTKIYVGTEDPIKNIQEAIHAASDGLTIVVRNGTYIENIIVNKSLVIESEKGAMFTTIIAKDCGMDALEIIADGTVLQGFSLYGAIEYGAGIKIQADNCKLMNNVCGISQDKMNTYGILLSKKEGYSTVAQSQHVIAGNHCSYNSVSGIYADTVDHSIIKDNILSYNSNHGLCGIRFVDSIIQNNQFLYNKDGIDIVLSDSIIICDNELIQNSSNGLHLIQSNNITIISNILKSNMHSGIQLGYDSNNNLIYHNSLIANNKNIELFEDINNKWFSQTPLYYEFKGKSYKSKIGNYFSDHDLADTDQNGITDDFYILPSNNIKMDQYPLSMQSENYVIQTWDTSDKNLIENQPVCSDTVSLNIGLSLLWVTSKPLETDSVFNESNAVSGQICLTSTPTQNTVFNFFLWA